MITSDLRYNDLVSVKVRWSNETDSFDHEFGTTPMDNYQVDIVSVEFYVLDEWIDVTKNLRTKQMEKLEEFCIDQIINLQSWYGS
jgi:hypothetical protein